MPPQPSEGAVQTKLEGRPALLLSDPPTTGSPEPERAEGRARPPWAQLAQPVLDHQRCCPLTAGGSCLLQLKAS